MPLDAGIIGGQALGAGLGMILGDYNDKRQLEQQKKLTDVQAKANKEQARYSHELQYDMWNKTNYEGQMAHMKKAGLNPGLMYGMGGGGGTTTGGASAQGVSGGNAPQGGNEVIASQGLAMQMKAQTELLQAQKRNIEADTNNKLAGAGKDTATTEGQNLANKWEKYIQQQGGTEDGTSLKERGLRLEQNKDMAQIMNLGKQAEAISAGVKNTEQDTAIKRQAFEMLEKMNPLQLQKFEKEVELIVNNPMNTQMGQWGRVLLDIIKVLK